MQVLSEYQRNYLKALAPSGPLDLRQMCREIVATSEACTARKAAVKNSPARTASHSLQVCAPGPCQNSEPTIPKIMHFYHFKFPWMGPSWQGTVNTVSTIPTGSLLGSGESIKGWDHHSLSTAACLQTQLAFRHKCSVQ
jgi:hypothetical protein